MASDSKTSPVPTPEVLATEAEKSTEASGSAKDAPALSKKILDLKMQQAAMLAERKRVTKDLRNLEKRRKRLKSNARRLSDDDLAEVLRMREHSKTTDDSVERDGGKTKKKERAPLPNAPP